MTLAEEIFEKHIPVRQKLTDYGFAVSPDDSELLTYRSPLMDGELTAEVSVRFPEGRAFARVLDTDTGEEYTLVNVSASSGPYVGAVRDELRALLEDITGQCFFAMPFVSDQANRITALIAGRFHVSPDFPFDKPGDAGVFRHETGGKWFALVMRIPYMKLEDAPARFKDDPDAPVDIMNLKIDPEALDKLLEEPGIYRCYHMNKRLWVTLALDETLSDDRILDLIDESYKRTGGRAAAPAAPGKKGHWIIPSNPAMFDVEGGFRASGTNTLTWHARIRVQPGDIVYIYQTNPIAALRFKCRVTDCGPIDPGSVWSKSATRIMYLKLLEIYDPERFPRSWLNEHGIKKTVRGQRSAPAEMVLAIEEAATQA